MRTANWGFYCFVSASSREKRLEIFEKLKNLLDDTDYFVEEEKYSYGESKIFFNDQRSIEKALDDSSFSRKYSMERISINFIETIEKSTKFDFTLNEHRDFKHWFARVIISLNKEKTHDKQNADTTIRVPAIESGVVGRSIPREFIPNTMKGLESGVRISELTGGPAVGFDVTLTDGAFHDQSSDGEAFEEAGRKALQLAMSQAGRLVLEPELQVQVWATDYYAGEVVQFFEKRGRELQSKKTVENGILYKGKCPASSVSSIEKELNQCTGATATFELKHYGYRSLTESDWMRLYSEKNVDDRSYIEVKSNNEINIILGREKNHKFFRKDHKSNPLLVMCFSIVHMVYCEIIPSFIRPRFRINSKKIEERLDSHNEWLATDGESGRRLILYSVNLRGHEFFGRQLDKSILRDCDLRGSRFAGVRAKPAENGIEASEKSSVATLKYADFSYSKVERAVFAVPREFEHAGRASANLTGAQFVGCSGVFGADGAYFGNALNFDPTEPPIVQRWLPGTSIGDFPSWNVVGAFQNLRLLAVSNTLAIILVFYAAISSILNDQLASMQKALVESGYNDSVAKVINSIPPLPAPEHFGYLLVVVVALTVTNILYNYLCPQSIGSQLVVSSYSDAGSSVFQSLSARYSGFIGRWFCFISLGACCLYIAFYLFQRVIEAIEVYLPSLIN